MARSAPHVTAEPGPSATAVVDWLRQHGSPAVRDGMARFAIPSDRAFGHSVGALRSEARRLQARAGAQAHELAAALWASGWYEARLLAIFIDDPARVGARQMDAWARDFDNWAICDTACFHLFDHSAAAWGRVSPWCARRGEFQRRAGFALLWALAVHDKQAGDAPFLAALPLIAAAAGDDRHVVRKAVNMALRAIGKRSPVLHAAALAQAQRLAEAATPSARWIGRDALKELRSIVPRSPRTRRPSTP